MSETTERLTDPGSGPEDSVTRRVRSLAPGLTALVAEAEATWVARYEAAAPGGSIDLDADGRPGPGWRSFEDAFPTFYQFTNRPPR
jgi:hypothetical protein